MKKLLFHFATLALLFVPCLLYADSEDLLKSEIDRLLTESAFDLTVPDNPTVRAEIQRITGPDRKGMVVTLKRSAIWCQPVAQMLAEAKMPAGLIALLMQESAFSPKAVSRTGAAGLWQFKPATARLFGLRRDAFLDERFEPEASTRAAIKYLAQLQVQFKDWDLAMAAYNWGKGAMSRCIEANQGQADFWKLADKGAIRDETRRYVPSIYARLAVWRNPEKYGLERPGTDAPIRANVPPFSSLKKIEAACELGTGSISNLNPHLRSAVTPPYKSQCRIWIPASAKNCVSKLTAKAITLSPDRIPGIQKRYHVVKRGDTLWGLSRRFDSSVDSLLEYNGWKSAPALAPGQKVLIYLRTDN